MMIRTRSISGRPETPPIFRIRLVSLQVLHSHTATTRLILLYDLHDDDKLRGRRWPSMTRAVMSVLPTAMIH